MQVFELPNADDAPRAIAFSPDGTQLAVWTNGRVFAIDTGAGRVRTLCAHPDSARAEGSGLAFTEDGKYVLARHASSDPESRGPDNANIIMSDAETGATERGFALHTLNDGLVSTPDGRTVLVAIHPTPDRATAEFVRWNPLTNERSEPFARYRGVVRQLAVSTDGQWLAGTFGDPIRLWRLSAKKPPTRAAHKMSIGPEFAMCLALSADGAFVAAGGFRGNVHLITVAGGKIVLEPRPRDAGRDLAFHPALPVLAYSGTSDDVVFYDAVACATLKRFAWGIGDVSAVCFSPDGLRCAAGAVGKVVVWDVDV